MEIVNLNCEVVTPMFCYGADQSSPDVREGSLKGMIHFWWRALNGETDLVKLFRTEASKLGSSINNDSHKSPISLVILSKNLTLMKGGFSDKKVTLEYGSKIVDVNIFKYIGYPHADNGNNGKPYIQPGSTFVIRLSSKNKELIDEVIRIIHVIGEYGGIGAKSRNGFGRFKVTNHPEGKPFEINLSNLRGKHAPISYTTINEKSEYVQLEENFSLSSELHLALGKKYILGRKEVDRPHNIDKRQYLGLPVKGITSNGKSFGNSRHPKAIFFHIRKLNNRSFEGGFLYTGYQFLSGLPASVKGYASPNQTEYERSHSFLLSKLI